MITGKRDSNKQVTILRNIVFAYCLFQIITEINHDWRYRDPIIPLMILLCAYGTVKFNENKADKKLIK